MALKDRLKKVREACSISQAELADRLDLSVGGIGGYENGSRFPKQRILDELAEFFRVPVDDLAFGPELTPGQYAAFAARLEDALDHTSSDDFEAMELSEREIRTALKQRTPIREDRAVELAAALGTCIDDILKAEDLQAPESPLDALKREAESLTAGQIADVQKFIAFLRSQK